MRKESLGITSRISCDSCSCDTIECPQILRNSTRLEHFLAPLELCILKIDQECDGTHSAGWKLFQDVAEHTLLIGN